MPPLKVGIVGAGGIAAVYAKLWGKVPGTKLVGIVDPNLARAQAMAKPYRVPAFTSLRDLGRATGADVVCVCTPSGTHSAVAQEAIRAGMDVFVEKPIDIEVSKALGLLKTARRAKAKLAVSSQKRWAKASTQVRQWVKSGKLGKIFLFRAVAPWYRSQRYYDKGRRGTFRADGGGALIIQAIHMVDLALYLTGKKAVSASAASGTFTHRIEVEDTLVGHLRMADGSLGQVLASTSVHPGFAERVELYGEKGTVIWEGGRVVYSDFRKKPLPDEGRWTTSDKMKFSKKPEDAFETSFLAQLKDAALYFKTGRGRVVSGESAAQTLAVIEALYKSARTRKEASIRRIKGT
jgi:predicted dehydrogenase